MCFFFLLRPENLSRFMYWHAYYMARMYDTRTSTHLLLIQPSLRLDLNDFCLQRFLLVWLSVYFRLLCTAAHSLTSSFSIFWSIKKSLTFWLNLLRMRWWEEQLIIVCGVLAVFNRSQIHAGNIFLFAYCLFALLVDLIKCPWHGANTR